jgi:ArsR family transcriptional regulator
VATRTAGAGRLTAIFRALADPTRLRILSLLRAGETCVGDLVTVLGVPQPSASRHLAYLRRVGLVTARRDEQWVHYSLAPARGGVHAKLVELLEAVADGPEAKADAKRAAKLWRDGGCCPGSAGRDEKAGGGSGRRNAKGRRRS